MRNRIILILFLAMSVAMAVAANASANSQASRFWSTNTDAGWKGSRVTVDNPDSSQAQVSSGDFFLTSSYADNGPSGASLIQVGVTYEWNAPEGPSCNLGSQGNGAKLYYFAEIEQNGVYSCYHEGLASFSTAHKMTVDRGDDGKWHPYIGGAFIGVSNQWSECNGNACTLAAFAENLSLGAGYWEAKYAGSGNTPWQFWNGATWNTINHASVIMDTIQWAGPFGPFPTGIWKFTYAN